MEVKIECPCGQPFEFDVEPVNGQMPCEVQCPSCNADATPLANRYIAENSPAPTPPVPVAPAPVIAAPPPGLRINREPAHAAPAPAAIATTAPAPMAIPAAPRAAKGEAPGDGFLKGVIGALIGASIGMIAWFLLIRATGYEIGWIAWGVGALTGIGARMVGAEGSGKLGMVAGTFALIAIIGGQFLALRSLTMKEFDKIAATTYQGQVDYAKQVTAAGTDADMKAIYAKENEEQVSDIKADEWQDFQKTELPRLKDLAAGKPSESEFISAFHKETISFATEFEMLKESFGIFTVLWIFLGVGSAYKLASGGNG